MKKILCLIDTLEMGGGAERQMAGLAGLLHQNGENVFLATYHPHSSDSILENKYGIHSELIQTGSSSLSKIIAIRKFLKKNKFDVIIAFKGGPTMICCILKLCGLKYTLIVSERNTTQVLSFREKMKFFLYRYADFIVPNSVTQGDFISLSFPELKEKVKVITNFTDTNYFKPLDEIVLRDDDRLHILITARIAEQKNVLGFLRVVRRLKDNGCNVRIDWYGSVYAGQRQYGEKVMKLYHELDIEDTLFFHPATPQILMEYQRCDVFCLPSFYEGYPNVICEAMSCGKPIICSKICDNPFIVEEGENGFLFDPTCLDSIYKTISEFALLPYEILHKMGQKSREIAINKFSEDAFAKKYIALIYGER